MNENTHVPQEKAKRIAEVSAKLLVKDWISPDSKLEPVKSSDGFIDIKRTVDKLLKSNILYIDKIPLFYRFILTDIASGSITYMEGLPGIGKSESCRIIKELLDELGIKTTVIILNLAAMEPTDLVGEKLIPSSNSKFTVNVVSEELYEIRENKEIAYIIFLDEINRALPHMITTSMKLFDGVLNPRYSMTPNTCCISAGNLGEADDTDVIPFEDMDGAFRERVNRIVFQPDSNSWILLNKENEDIDPSLFSKIENSIDHESFKNFVFCSHKYRPFSPRRLTMFLVNLSKKKGIFSKKEIIKFIDQEMDKKIFDDILDQKGYVNKNYSESLSIEDQKIIPGLRENIRYIKKLFIDWIDNKEIDLSLIDIFNYDYKPEKFINAFKDDIVLLTLLKDELFKSRNDEDLIKIREGLNKGFKESGITLNGNEKSEFAVFAIKHYKKIIEKLYKDPELKNEILSVFNNYAQSIFKDMLRTETFRNIFFTPEIKTVDDIKIEYIDKQLTSKKLLETLNVKMFKELFAIAIFKMEDTNSMVNMQATLKDYFQLEYK